LRDHYIRLRGRDLFLSSARLGFGQLRLGRPERRFRMRHRLLAISRIQLGKLLPRRHKLPFRDEDLGQHPTTPKTEVRPLYGHDHCLRRNDIRQGALHRHRRRRDLPRALGRLRGRRA